MKSAVWRSRTGIWLQATAAFGRLTAIPAGHLGVFAGFALLFSLAWWIYRPDVPRAFDLVDFPFILPLLQENDGVGAQTRALAQMYGEEGRFNVVLYVLIAMQWSLFGLNVCAWQLARFGLMGGVLVLAFFVFRGLHLTRSGALVGASIFVLSPAATHGWTWFTLPEPVGVGLLLIVALISIHRSALTQRYRLLILTVVALLVATVLLTKEMLLAACVLPVLASWVASASRHGVKERSLDWDMLTAGTVGAMVALAPIAWVYLAAPPTAYAARYTLANTSTTNLIGSLWSALIPFTPLPGSGAILFVVLLAFVAATSVGWLYLPRSPVVSPVRLAAMAVSLPAVGAIAFAPWPSYRIGYALPYLFGGALLVAGAVSGLQHAPRVIRISSVPALVLVLAYTLSATLAEARPVLAFREALGSFLPLVNREAHGDSVVVGATTEQVASATTLSFHFPRLAHANGVPWPTTVSASCADASAIAEKHASVLVVGVSTVCPGLGPGYKAVSVNYSLFDWNHIRITASSVQLRLLRAGMTR